MQVRKLEEDYQKIEFLKAYNESANMNVREAYVLTCDVYAAFVDDKMVGGYAFAFGENIVWKNLIKTDFFEKVDINECFEVNLFWADKSIRNSPMKIFGLWFNLRSVIANMKSHKYPTFAVDPVKKSLVEAYTRCSEGEVYLGDVGPKYPGRQIQVWWSTTEKFQVKNSIGLIIKIFRDRHTKKRYKLKLNNDSEALSA